MTGAEIERLAQAHYAHLWQLVGEFVRFRWLSAANASAPWSASRISTRSSPRSGRGKGVLILTGHFGNWEVATMAGIAHYPELRGRFHFVRRPIKPRWLDALVTRRFNRAGFGVIGKRGSLDAIVSLLERGDVVVFPFDQYAGGADGIDVEFFGQPAGTFKSLAIIALATGAPVLAGACWRDPTDGTCCASKTGAGRGRRQRQRVDLRAPRALSTRRSSDSCCGIPEQWWWVHRRWKIGARAKPRRRDSQGERRRGRIKVAARSPRTSAASKAVRDALDHMHMLTTMLAPKFIVLYVFIASAMYVHYRGRVRHGFFRQLTDHSTLMAPYNALMYLFSAVPNRPYVEVEPVSGARSRSPTIGRRSATRRCSSSTKDASAPRRRTTISASIRSSRRGWKRFYVKWYDEPLPSAKALCPKTVELVSRSRASTRRCSRCCRPAASSARIAIRSRARCAITWASSTPNSDSCRIVVDGEPYFWRDGEAGDVRRDVHPHRPRTAAT